VTPLLHFQGKVVNLGSKLPEDGKAAEVVKRIGFAVVSPFVYLALAFVALTGLILNGIWDNRQVSQGGVNNQGGKDLAGITAEQAESGKAFQIPRGTFGKEVWEKTFPVTIGEVPPLPSNIEEILEFDDPCEPGKKLKDTCLLFLRPKKVILHEVDADKEIMLGFDSVEKLASMATNPDRRTKYKTSENLRSQLNQMPVAEAGWVLMRKEVIPGTGGKNFESQKGLLKGGFEVPKLMDAVLLNILYFASEGKCLFGKKPWSYTRCQEMYGNHQVIVGGFCSFGLNINTHKFDHSYDGLAGVWKL
jgi:hypothetical protein